MSGERFSCMDEGSLRKLLEVTLDLAERKEIRSAIRELRRKELERCEEALASKRFRSERSHEQENKENQPRADREEQQQRALNALTIRLQNINDLEELTSLLRNSKEYEERKLIRAAIRKVRNDEIEAASLGGMLIRQSSERDNGKLVCKSQDAVGNLVPSLAQEREDLEERQKIRAQIHELRSAQNGGSHIAGSKEIESNMLLRLKVPTKEQLPSSTSSSSSTSSFTSFSSEPSSSSHCQATELLSLSAEFEGQPHNNRNEVFMEPSAEDSGTETREQPNTHVASHKQNVKSEQKPLPVWTGRADSHIISRLGADNKESFPEGVTSASCSEPDDQTSMPPFRRAYSVRDRVKKFSEESSSVTTPALGFRFGSMRAERAPVRGAHVLQQHSLLSVGQENNQKAAQNARFVTKQEVTRTVSGPCTRRLDGIPTAGTQSTNKIQSFKSPFIPELNNSRSTSLKGSSSLSSTGPCTSSREVNRGLPQSQGSFILKQNSGRSQENQLKVPLPMTERGRIDENSDGANTEGPGSLQSSTHLCKSTKGTREETEDTDMKTLLTIEIKDGRNQTTSSRVVGQPGNQRAELMLGLTSSPFRINSGFSTSNDGASSGITTRSIRTETRTTTQSGITSSSNVIKEKKRLRSDHQMEERDQDRQQCSGEEGSAVSSVPAEAPLSDSTCGGDIGEVEAETPQETPQQLEVFLPSTTEKAEPENKGKLTAEDLNAIEEEEVLDKMLDKATDFEERKLIRAAMRDLRQRKREQREKEREQRLQELKNKERESQLARSTETSIRQSETTNHGSAVSTVTKTQRLVQSNDGSKTSSTTTLEASYMKRSENGDTIVQTKSSFSATSKKVGSIFDREDEGLSRANSMTAMERRQAERKKELMKAQSLPKTPATQARKAMIEKMEKESGGSSSPAFAKVATPRSAAFGVPNANSIKQMLLDWCKAKTRGYEHVNIQNFSSSWSDGMAFCALVHNFFPEAFDYNQLNPQNRRKNFDLAFSAAEKHADCPQLLDAEDMVRMREPDWKCVYTYIQEFYRCLVQKGMVKTKKS
ncbi:smoothelin isoform X2 [Xenopus tropicalis]|uniref:Smoothelin isoform X2 n=1 Tax=Xenopus tropicalis TaxID=8364 RepID=A0A8J0SYE9_XENTR|nr:smoothelin isoform X2 [Xenopus tropicalis]